ncbi:hypothetical protein EAH_00053060 [Eimeria acervulina]|uniref:Transmembrane protein n=1 Tax=Eimeria acervulina TaxID=5801 RepID=U6GWB6_EIMAC|nr:hypothetical protein EAH_00053060 [Eimeria acervulina]CDI84495.1 hypothetical protein EAH_00053060 [Eimeria acervulina]
MERFLWSQVDHRSDGINAETGDKSLQAGPLAHTGVSEPSYAPGSPTTWETYTAVHDTTLSSQVSSDSSEDADSWGRAQKGNEGGGPKHTIEEVGGPEAVVEKVGGDTEAEVVVTPEGDREAAVVELGGASKRPSGKRISLRWSLSLIAFVTLLVGLMTFKKQQAQLPTGHKEEAAAALVAAAKAAAVGKRRDRSSLFTSQHSSYDPKRRKGKKTEKGGGVDANTKDLFDKETEEALMSTLDELERILQEEETDFSSP